MHLVAAGAQLDAFRCVDVAQTDGTCAPAAGRLDGVWGRRGGAVGALPFRARRGVVLGIGRGELERRVGLARAGHDARRRHADLS